MLKYTYCNPFVIDLLIMIFINWVNRHVSLTSWHDTTDLLTGEAIGSLRNHLVFWAKAWSSADPYQSGFCASTQAHHEHGIVTTGSIRLFMCRQNDQRRFSDWKHSRESPWVGTTTKKVRVAPCEAETWWTKVNVGLMVTIFDQRHVLYIHRIVSLVLGSRAINGKTT